MIIGNNTQDGKRIILFQWELHVLQLKILISIFLAFIFLSHFAMLRNDL